jgi:hypothetical protein
VKHGIWATVAFLGLAFAALLLAQGCGRPVRHMGAIPNVDPGTGVSSFVPTQEDGTAEDTEATVVQTSSTTERPASVGTLFGPPDRDVVTAFAGLAAQAGSLTLYAPTEVPSGATIARSWWPLSAGQEPPESGVTGSSNPYVVGDGSRPEVRVLFRVGAGWLELLEGVRGDLGELPGELVGSVSGHTARAYRLLGGDLVQWSDQGAWYAVYGRGMKREDVVRFARGMRPWAVEP